jgi:two-component system sensor kinase FixL
MPGFFIVVLAMGYELIWDLIAAAQLAAQLRASEHRFRAVVEAVPSAILLVDGKGMIALANAQAETVFGYQKAELVAKPVEKLIPERLRIPHVGLRGAYARDPRARAMGAGRELFACRKDGGEIPVEVALSPMPAEEGLFVLVSVVDITERINAERATARQRDDFAHLSRVAMLGELSGSLAHELNQPLTAILSNAQAAQRFLAQSPPRIDKLAEILTDIVKSDHRAEAVIQRLRSLLRKEESQRHLLDVNEVVEESLRLIRSDLLNRQVVVSTALAEALPAVSGDRNQLQQVLLNFVINGCDAMDGQAADRRLLVRTQATVHGNIEVCVVDRGAGIPLANLERIFEPFVTTKATGMGLGLAICRSIPATVAHRDRSSPVARGRRPTPRGPT